MSAKLAPVQQVAPINYVAWGFGSYFVYSACCFTALPQQAEYTLPPAMGSRHCVVMPLNTLLYLQTLPIQQCCCATYMTPCITVPVCCMCMFARSMVSAGHGI
jgi:hypothetical protein